MSTFYFCWHKNFAHYALLSISLFILCACGSRTEEASIFDARIDSSVYTEVSTIDVSANDSGCEVGKPFYGDRVQYFGECSLSTMGIIVCTTETQFPSSLDCLVRLSDGAIYRAASLAPVSEAEWRTCTKEEFNRAWKTPPCKQDAGVGDTK